MRRLLRGVMIVLLAVGTLAGCGGGDDDDGILNPPDSPEQRPGEGNRPPVAIAGENRSVLLGTGVRLDASASTDPEGAPLSFSWSLEKPPESIAVLDDPTTPNPFFVPDVTGTYRAVLEVSDGTSTDLDSVEITVRALADAGPDRNVAVGESVTLNAQNSLGPGGRTLNFSWFFVERPLASDATLTTPNDETASFVADEPGRYTVRLTVSDENGQTVTDDVTITAGSPDQVRGELLYQRRCARCHSLGNFDRNATGGAPDLSGRGTVLPSVFDPVHQGIALAPEDFPPLQIFLDSQ